MDVIELYPYGSLFDSTRFEIMAERLTLHYLSYPLDAPVVITLELSRILDSTQ